MKAAPDPKEILEFLFKQYKNWKIADGFESIPAACSLVSVDYKRGLIYTACDNKITVLKSGDSNDNEWRKEYMLPGKISRLSLNCDCSLLAIALQSPTAYIYNAASLTQQHLELLREIKLSSADNIHIFDLRWNPCIPGMLCTVTSDHTIGSFNITADKNSAVLTVLEKLEKLDVLCVAWSPKGKQLVVGCKNGNLVQLKPDLKVARTIPGPNPSVGSVIALLWISNYQFCAAYFDVAESGIKVIIVDAPKGEVNASFTCYEDITYGSLGIDGGEGGPRYYFEHVSEWGLIIAASSGSSEVAVLGSRDNGSTWEQWQLVDHGRAELPFVRTRESYPVGLSVDRTSVKKLPWGGEGSTLPHPVPILHIFGTSGQLCSFHMVNLMAGIPPICSPPTETVPSTSQPRASLAPSEISLNLTGLVTSTPRPKQIDAMPDKSKAAAASANLFVDSTRVAVAAPRPPVELNVPKPQTVKVDALPKVDVPVAPSREIKQQEKVGIDSNICIHAYQEECSLFEKELRNRKELQAVDIGTEDERNEIIEKSEEMDQFLTELKETTAGLTSDISYLKALLLQTFDWMEETKSRSSSNGSYNLQSYGDSHKLKELQQLMRYVQSQREEVTRVLDDEWLEHINREKIKMKIPKLDFVSQIMLQQSQIIAEKRNLINALVKNWKSLTRGDNISSLNKSMANISLSVIPPGLNGINGAIEQRCRTIATKNYSFSRDKQSKLRNLLIQSKTKVITSVTPSTIQDRLEAMLSSLATHSPPPVKVRASNKDESKPVSKVVMPDPPVRAAKSPLASLDRIVANIGSGEAQVNITLQNNVLELSPEIMATPVRPPVIKVPQAQVKSPTSESEQAKQNKPITIPLFGTPPTSIPGIHGGPMSAPLYEVSPFTSNVSRTSVPSSLPPGLLPAATTEPSTIQPFPKPDTSLLGLATTKKNRSPNVPISTVTPSSTTTSALVPSPSSQTSSQTSVSFPSSAPPPPRNQVPSYPTAMRTPSTMATMTSISVTSSTSVTIPPIQSSPFGSQPASGTLPFTSRPVNTSQPSDVTQSLDLSAMGFAPQAPSNTPAENANVAPLTSGAGNNLFTSAAGPPLGTIFGGSSFILKEKPQGGTPFGNAPTSSIFGGTVGGSTSSVFGGNVTTPSLKPPAYGSNPAAPPASIFGGSPAAATKSIVGDIPTTTPPASGFQNSSSSSVASVFGNVSGISSGQSIFGGNTASLTSTSTPGAAANFLAQASVPTSTPSIFGKALDSKALAAVATTSGPAPSSPFETSSPAPTSPMIFSGPISNPTKASSFTSTLSNSNTAEIFSRVQPLPQNPSIFGGGASSPNSATNVETFSQRASAVPTFGQSAAFGAKLTFEPNNFRASKPPFESTSGNTGFLGGSQTANPFGGLNTPTPMGDNVRAFSGNPMQNLFSETSGSKTFGNLATQEGLLTFSNLAQNQAEQASAPEVPRGTSFQNWR